MVIVIVRWMDHNGGNKSSEMIDMLHLGADFFKHVFTYLAASDLSCMPDLHFVMQDLSLWCMDSLAVVQGLSSCGTEA